MHNMITNLLMFHYIFHFHLYFPFTGTQNMYTDPLQQSIAKINQRKITKAIEAYV